jgi:hypothetical protein
MASTTSACASVSVTSLGASRIAGLRRASRRSLCGDPAARRQALSCASLNCRGRVPRPRLHRARQPARAARAAGARADAGVLSSRRPARQAPALDGGSRRLARAQARRQRRGEHLAERVVVVVGRPAQQVEGDRIEDRLAVQDLERALELRAAMVDSETVQPGCRSAVGGRRARARARRAGTRSESAGPVPRAADSRKRGAAACRARLQNQGVFCPQKLWISLLRKPGSFTLSARSVSGPGSNWPKSVRNRNESFKFNGYEML